MSFDFAQCKSHFQKKGFFLTAHPVVLHHLRKEFQEYEVSNERFYILPVGPDFLHVAVIEHEYGTHGKAVQIRYTCAGDDLLYGLRTKFNSGGAQDNEITIMEINSLLLSGDLRAHERYVRRRFRHGRAQAKVRAAIVMASDIWRSILSSFKLRQV